MQKRQLKTITYQPNIPQLFDSQDIEGFGNMDFYNFSTVSRPSDDDTAILGMIIQASQQVQRELGYDAYEFPLSNVQRVIKDDIRSRTHQLHDALYANGYIYLGTDLNGDDLIMVFSHELAHALAKQTLNVKIVNIEERRVNLSLGRCGYQYQSNTGCLGPFTGLNEAVTEMLANKIRNKLLDMRTDLNISNSTRIRKSVSYYVQVAILEAYVKHISESMSISQDEIMKKIFSDYFEGTISFLKLLPKYKKNFLQQLSLLPATFPSIKDWNNYLTDLQKRFPLPEERFQKIHNLLEP